MEDSFDVDINQLKKAFNLNARQEDFIRVVLESRNYELEESKFRDKLRAMLPALVPSFQHYVSTLQNMDILSVYYDKDGKRIIGMSPTLNEIKLNDSVPLGQGEIKAGGRTMNKKSGEPRKLKLSHEDIQRIGARIIDIIKTSPRLRVETSVLLSTIEKEYDISGSQFKKVLEAVKTTQRIVRTYEGYGKARKSFISIAPLGAGDRKGEKKPPYGAYASPQGFGELIAAREKEKLGLFNFSIDLKKEDVDAMVATLKELDLPNDPTTWLNDVVQEAIINIMDKKAGSNVIRLTMANDTWEKFVSLQEMYKADGKEDMLATIDNMISKFINDEFAHKFIVKQLADIISKSNDVSVLVKIKDMVTVRLSDIPTYVDSSLM
jgi:hypothetical protein